MPVHPPGLAVCIIASLMLVPAAADERETHFEKHVRPILVERCFACHGAEKQQAGLRLDSAEFIRQGNDSGPALVPGKPDESRLMDVVAYDESDYQMPPAGKLPESEIAALRLWIEQGAYWPESFRPAEGTTPAVDPSKTHWAFQPVRRPELPSVRRTDWPQTPIDRFVLARLEEAGLSPSPEADRQTWLRRVTFGLTGLPPTAAECDAFLKDTSPDAYEKVVARLLDSPRYGERWARHWLDVSRYADTKGYVFQEDRNYPKAWTYRDWVIRAFNEDMPYDRFVRYQLAADRLVTAENSDEQAAMGFLTLGRRFLNNVHDVIDDRIDVTTRGLMGLTVACARCHDHKYDPIPQADYYSLYGVFRSSDEPKDGPSPLRLVDADKPREPYIFLRGQAGNRGPRVPRQFLEVVTGDERQPFTDGSGRLEMAEAIVSPENPLTARVFVNRVWGKHFGSHLVDTPSDFGVRSDPPTHPDLLDWLAAEFIESGWSIKHLHRLIVLSAVYRQTSQEARVESPEPESSQTRVYSGSPSPSLNPQRSVDPENRLLWRMNRQRLDFEAHRDALLAVAGRLEFTMGGPSVQLTTEPFSQRRSVYGFIDRQNLPGMFRTFDFASPDTHSPMRYVTTVPQQALFQLNAPFVMQQAAALAERSIASEAEDRIRQMYRLVYAREPAAHEIALGRTFIENAQANMRPEFVGSSWQYGYGQVDDATQRVVAFHPLPHWTGSAWQGGPELPADKTGWAMLNADGGHAGENPEFMVIRRWMAREDGVVDVNGRLRHPAKEGDGVRGRVVSSRDGVLGEWMVHHGDAETAVKTIHVQAGDTLDFVVDSRGNVGWDSFQWKVRLQSESAVFDSAAQFHGPEPPPLTAWEQYAQVLLLSNEFVFID